MNHICISNLFLSIWVKNDFITHVHDRNFFFSIACITWLSEKNRGSSLSLVNKSKTKTIFTEKVIISCVNYPGDVACQTTRRFIRPETKAPVSLWIKRSGGTRHANQTHVFTESIRELATTWIASTWINPVLCFSCGCGRRLQFLYRMLQGADNENKCRNKKQ